MCLRVWRRRLSGGKGLHGLLHDLLQRYCVGGGELAAIFVFGEALAILPVGERATLMLTLPTEWRRRQIRAPARACFQAASAGRWW